MYRLHNLGIDAKIDWLVKKGKLINNLTVESLYH